MTELTNFLFLTALALLLTHEIDAVKQHEWRILPVLRHMDDSRGFFWFTVLHAPLYVPILYWIDAPAFRLSVSIFMVGHACAHWILRKHPKYTFNNLLSNGLIYGAAGCAIAHLLLT